MERQRRIPGSMVRLIVCLASSAKLTMSQENGTSSPFVTLPCTICRGGEPVGLPDKIVTSEGILAGQTCDQLDDFVGILYPNASAPDCQAIQSVGTICGCPAATNTCTLCGNAGERPLYPDKTIDSLGDLLFPGITPTCELVEAFLWSTDNAAEDGLCLVAHEFLAGYCGCPSAVPTTTSNDVGTAPCSICPNVDDTMLYANRTLNMEGLPFETCQDLQVAAGELLWEGSDRCSSLQVLANYCGCTSTLRSSSESVCTLCPDGTAAPLGDNLFPLLSDLFGGFTPSCAVVEASLVGLVEPGSDECEAVQLFSSLCGCQPVEEHCNYCDELDTVPEDYAQTTIYFGAYFLEGESSDLSVTCEDAWMTQYQLRRDDRRCYLGRQGSFFCGCNGGDPWYHNADTEFRKIVLAWAPRISGLVSIIVSANVPFPFNGFVSIQKSFFSFFRDRFLSWLTCFATESDEAGCTTWLYS